MKYLLMIIIILSLTGCSRKEEKDYNTTKLSYSTEEKDRTDKEGYREEIIASFSTKVSQKDPDRQTNITIACQSLNGTIVKAGETFSFCDTLGPAKPEDGYEKADTFDSDGDTIQAYGGGKCQVSTTLYNAVLAVPSLTVVERNAHSGPVYYVEEGKDACVSYGSCDFKFTNTNNFDIKLYFSNTPDSVDVSIAKISS